MNNLLLSSQLLRGLKPQDANILVQDPIATSDRDGVKPLLYEMRQTAPTFSSNVGPLRILREFYM